MNKEAKLERVAAARAQAGRTRENRTKIGILAAARQLVAEAEATNTSVTQIKLKDIAVKAPVGLSTIYAHYPGGLAAIAVQLVDEARAIGEQPNAELVALANVELTKGDVEHSEERAIYAATGNLNEMNPEEISRARELVNRADKSSSLIARGATRAALARCMTNDSVLHHRHELEKIHQEILDLCGDRPSASFVFLQASALQGLALTLLAPDASIASDDAVARAVSYLRRAVPLLKAIHGVRDARWNSWALYADMLEMRDEQRPDRIRSAVIKRWNEWSAGAKQEMLRGDTYSWQCTAYLGALVLMENFLGPDQALDKEIREAARTIKFGLGDNSDHGHDAVDGVLLARRVLMTVSDAADLSLDDAAGLAGGELCAIFARAKMWPEYINRGERSRALCEESPAERWFVDPFHSLLENRAIRALAQAALPEQLGSTERPRVDSDLIASIQALAHQVLAAGLHQEDARQLRSATSILEKATWVPWWPEPEK